MYKVIYVYHQRSHIFMLQSSACNKLSNALNLFFSFFPVIVRFQFEGSVFQTKHRNSCLFIVFASLALRICT